MTDHISNDETVPQGQRTLTHMGLTRLGLARGGMARDTGSRTGVMRWLGPKAFNYRFTFGLLVLLAGSVAEAAVGPDSVGEHCSLSRR